MAKLDQTVPKLGGDDSGSGDERARQTLALVRTLIASLPASEREKYFHEVAQTLKTATAPKAGEVLGTILRLLPRQKQWTVAEIKAQVDERGVEATHKEIYNAVGYLTRKGRVRRVGYGKYLVDGALLDTADDFGLENYRYEDAYRVDRSTE